LNKWKNGDPISIVEIGSPKRSKKMNFNQISSKIRIYLSILYYLVRHPRRFYNALSARGKKWAMRGLIFLLIILIAVPATFWYQAKHAKAAWWNDNWAYRQKIQLTNSTGADLTDFQVSTVVDTASLITAGKMITSTCADMRFTDNRGQPLDYWIEENNPGCNSATTKVWIKAPKVYNGTNATSIYMYYGNPSATATQSGDKTFEFFDDFNAASVNTTKWATTGTASQAGGNMTVGTASKIRSNTNYGYKNLEFRMQSGIVGDTTDRIDAAGFRDASDTNHAVLYTNDTSATNIYSKTKAGSSSGNGASVITSRTSMQSYRVNRYSAAGVKFYQNGNQLVDDTTNIPTGNLELEWGNLVNMTTNLDWVFVRAMASTDPTTSASAEEKGPGPVAYWKFDEGQGGTAKDSTVNHYDGTLGVGSSAPTWKPESECVSGKCLYFDGSGDNVDVNDINY
jgi:hypothetical protein